MPRCSGAFFIYTMTDSDYSGGVFEDLFLGFRDSAYPIAYVLSVFDSFRKLRPPEDISTLGASARMMISHIFTGWHT